MKQLIYIGTFFTASLLQAQSISNFGAVQNENGVLVSWVTDSGYICSNLTLLHSTDSINFEEIYAIPGICGSYTESQQYNFLHQDHPTGRSIYKLAYESSGPNCFYTNIIVPDLNNLQFYPNPVTNKATLINPINNGQEAIFSLFTLSGEVVMELTTFNSLIQIDFSSIKNGVYIFQLTQNNYLFRNRVVVSH